MTVYRLQTAVWNDSLGAKDACVIDPCFKVVNVGTGTDPQQLCTDLAAAVKAKLPFTGQVRVRAYVLPYVRGAGHVGEATENAGTSPASVTARELALCLSFYASTNVKRRRGRLYMPVIWTGATAIGVRPTSPQMTAILSWRTMFEGLGGVNVDWVVWSDVDQTSRPVTDVWVDDEWDIIRSRGLRGTSRLTATTSEAGVPNLVRLQPAAAEIDPAASAAY